MNKFLHKPGAKSKEESRKVTWHRPVALTLRHSRRRHSRAAPGHIWRRSQLQLDRQNIAVYSRDIENMAGVVTHRAVALPKRHERAAHVSADNLACGVGHLGGRSRTRAQKLSTHSHQRSVRAFQPGVSRAVGRWRVHALKEWAALWLSAAALGIARSRRT